MNLDKDVAKFVQTIEKQGAKPLYELTPIEAREVLLKVQAASEILPKADVSEINIPLGGGRNMRVQIIKPLNTEDMLPIVFYLHGGGWVMGDEKTHERLIKEIANQTNAAVVFPVYEPSPEAKYPQTTTDIFTVLQHIVEHATIYGLNSENLVIAGDSVGANMALVMSLKAKENKYPEIKFQILLYPVGGANFETDSYNTYKNGPWLTKKAMQWFWDKYAPEKNKRKEINASPINASLEQLKDLPPTLVITDENDVLRDEGEALAQKLNDAGIKTASIRFNGTIHDFLMLNALADSAPSKAALLLVCATIKSVFAQTK